MDQSQSHYHGATPPTDATTIGSGAGGPWIAFRFVPWTRDAERLTPELEAMLLRITGAMVTRDEVSFPRDLDIARNLLRLRSTRKTERVLDQLVGLGVIALGPQGYTFPFAVAAVLERRKMIERNRVIARRRVSPKLGTNLDEVSPKHVASSHLSNARNANEDNETRSPAADQPDRTLEQEESYPTSTVSPAAARAGSRDFSSIGLGTGGAVTIEGRRRVCKQLSIGNADPLVSIYEAWPVSRKARNPDALFADVAPQLLQEAAPEIRRACQPLSVGEDAVRPIVPAQAGSALKAKLQGGRRHARR
jgi:hypothetical protein